MNQKLAKIQSVAQENYGVDSDFPMSKYETARVQIVAGTGSRKYLVPLRTMW